MHFFPFNNPNQTLFHSLRHPLLPDELALYLNLFSPAAHSSEPSCSTPPIHPTEAHVCLRRQHTSSSTGPSSVPSHSPMLIMPLQRRYSVTGNAILDGGRA